MSEAEVGDVKQKEEVGDDSSKNEVDCEKSVDNRNADNPMPSSEEEVIVIQWNGFVRKKLAFEKIRFQFGDVNFS